MKVAKVIGKVIICIFAAIGAFFTSAIIWGMSEYGPKPYCKAANNAVDDLMAGYYDEES